MQIEKTIQAKMNSINIFHLRTWSLPSVDGYIKRPSKGQPFLHIRWDEFPVSHLYYFNSWLKVETYGFPNLISEWTGQCSGQLSLQLY